MPATLAQLEARVAALEAGATGAETNSPNYLTLTPAGAVGALFSGGVQLIEAPALDPTNAAGTLRWMDPATPSIVDAYIQAAVSGAPPTHGLLLVSNPDTNDLAILELYTKVAGAKGSAGIQAQAYDNAGGAASAWIINSAGQSNFLQLPSTKQLAIDCGLSFVSFPSGTQWSSTTNVTHALGRVPVAVLLGGQTSSAGAFILMCINSGSITASGFSLRGYSPQAAVGAGDYAYFSWAAIG